MPLENELAALKAQVDRQAAELAKTQHAIGLLEDKSEIEPLQYTYGYLIHNRMFREMADLFADEGAWIEIGERGRYCGKERIHTFLLGCSAEAGGASPTTRLSITSSSSC